MPEYRDHLARLGLEMAKSSPIGVERGGPVQAAIERLGSPLILGTPPGKPVGPEKAPFAR